MAEVPARGETEYNTVVPTLADSTVEGMYYSTFFVSAVSSDPFVYWDSEPDSGYSVDNLAPSAPENLALSALDLLGWDEVPDDDLNYYTVYGSFEAELDETAVILGHTVETSLDVGGAVYQYYYVTATDFAGNEGNSGALMRTVSVPEITPAGPFLAQNRPNPLSSATTVTFAIPERADVTVQVFDVQGRLVRTLVDRGFGEGTHTVTWDARSDQGRPVTPGIYFLQLNAGEYKAIRKMTVVM